MILPVDHIHNLDSYITNKGEAMESVAGSDALCMDLWVPSERLSVHLVEAPSAPQRKWLELIPWMLEDRILQPVDEMHFVIAGRSAEGQLQVIAVSRWDMQEWLRVAGNAGVSARSLYPDYLALPWEAGRISVGWRDGLCLVRYGVGLGFAASPDMAWHMLDRLLQEAEIAPRLSISIADRALVPQHLCQIAAINQAVIDWSLPVAQPGVNLLSGQFKPQTQTSFTRWLPAAGLGLLAGVFLFVYLQMSNDLNAHRIESLEQQLQANYSRLFSGRKPKVTQIRSAAQQQLDHLFKQQQSLRAGPVAGLMVLGDLMTACDCDLKSLVAEQNSLIMLVDHAQKLKNRALDIPGYQLAISQQHNGAEDAIELRLSAEGDSR